MKDLLIEIIDRLMTTKSGTPYSKIKTNLPHKLQTLRELTDKQILEEMTNISTKETIYFPRMLAFEEVNDPLRRSFAQGQIGKLLFALRDVKRQGSPYGLEGVIAKDTQAILAHDFRRYMTLKLVYVVWTQQAYPRDDHYPLIVSEDDISEGKYEDAEREVLAVPTEAIEEFEDVKSAWDGELKRRGLDSYIEKRGMAVMPKPKAIKVVSTPRPTPFGFIRDNKIRALVERDFSDLQKARVWGSSRLRFVLAGGLIEGLLLDALMSHQGSMQTSAGKREKQQVEFWSLHSLLEAAAELSLVSRTIEKLSVPVRELRNFVHPGVEWRSNAPIEKEEVEIVEKILDAVIRDLSRLNKTTVQP